MAPSSTFKSVIVLLLSIGLLVVVCSGDQNACARIMSVLEDRSNKSFYDHHPFGIKFEHPYLDVSKGYVPNVEYFVSIINPRSIPIRELILLSLSIRRTKRESIGTFRFEKTDMVSHKCKSSDQAEGDIETLSTVSSDVRFPLTVSWTAPRDTSPDCALFKVAFQMKNSSNWTVIRERLCKNRGVYHFITGHDGSEEFSWQGPTTQTLIVEAAKSSSVYALIIRASYSGPSTKSTTCPGATIRVSTDAVERNFSASSSRVCVADAITRPTKVFRSTGVIVAEFVMATAGHLSFEFSYYNLPAEKGCNMTVIHRKSGTIQSPNYPAEYYGGMDCYYTIRAETEERIVGRFVELQLYEATSSSSPPPALRRCNKHGNDFVQLTSSGGSQQSALRWCGSKSASSTNDDTAYEFQSADHTLVIHFHSEPRSTRTQQQQHHRKFKIVWRSVASCPPSQKYVGMRGRITSVNYPGPYPNTQRCVYNIEVPAGFVVQLRFRDFRLQPTDRHVHDCERPTFAHDYVKVGEKKFCGNWTGRETEGLVFRSATNVMSFTFVSDEFTTHDGRFSAEFRAVTPNETNECRAGQSFFDGVCYDVKDHPDDWNMAHRTCQIGGGILAVVHSPGVQRFLNRLLTSIDGSEDHSYWIGGHDRVYESDFTWITGKKVEYSNWFHGWPTFDNYNKQPNDDGLSQQNCLELRRKFSHPSKGFGYADEFFWNDRECDARNGFVCQYPRLGASPTISPHDRTANCNETITLTSSAWKASVASPNYPRSYPDFVGCYVTVEPAPPGHLLILEFNKFILEEHTNCEYDYLEIWEEAATVDSADPIHTVFNTEQLCGDKSEELKLLRRVVAERRRIVLRFVTDHSRAFTGYQFTVYLDDVKLGRTLNPCNDKNWIHFDQSCYLIVYYPMVDWRTAKDICSATTAGRVLALPESLEEELFIGGQLLKTSEYKLGDAVWLGAKRAALTDSWKPAAGDQQRLNFTDWFPREMSFVEDIFQQWHMVAKDVCLTMQQQFQIGSSPSAAPVVAKRPYWGQRFCGELAGYVCKAPRPVITEGQQLNDTFFVNGSGSLTLPSHPDPYPNFFDYSIRLFADENTRILITFDEVGIEYQRHCLYDYVHLRTFDDDPPMNVCGTIGDRKPNFASYSNQAMLRFHSDSSVVGRGFVAKYQVINISDCFVDTDQPRGYINSVNFPDFYLNALDCTSTIRAPVGGRILLDFVYFDVGDRARSVERQQDGGGGGDPSNYACHQTDYVSIYLDGEYDSKYVRLCGKRLNVAYASRGLTFLSRSNVMRLAFHSDATVWGDGYRARYEILDHNHVNQSIYPNDTHEVLSPNYPLPYPPDFCLKQIYRAKYGFVLTLEFVELKMAYQRIEGDGVFLRASAQDGFVAVKNHTLITTTYWNRLTLDVCSDEKRSAGRYRAVMNVVEDLLFWRNKSVTNFTGLIESCTPNPCWNGGTCELGLDGFYCRCKLSYLGAFCHVSPCDLHPCVHGTCVVTATLEKYRCDCQLGYEGIVCDEEIHRCASNPCQHGTCVELLDSYKCICIDGYKGDNCQKADLLNAMTLRESFLRDPFWLGLFLVLGVIGIVGITRCFRKRFKYTGFARVQEEEEPVRRKETPEAESGDENADTEGAPMESAEERLGGEGEDGEVYFTLRDLGIGPSHYRNLGHFEKVSFKLKLTDLSGEELDVLEAYLQHIAATMDGVPEVSTTGTAGESPLKSPILQSAPFASALESVTAIILKSAEIVDENQRQEELEHRRANRQVSSYSAGAAVAVRRRRISSTASSVQHSQTIRGAARKAFQLVRGGSRATFVEFAEMRRNRAASKSLPGVSTFSLGRIPVSTPIPDPHHV